MYIMVLCTVQVKNWVKELRRMLGNDVVLCIVGNKTDMEKERHVTVEEAERYFLKTLYFARFLKFHNVPIETLS